MLPENDDRIVLVFKLAFQTANKINAPLDFTLNILPLTLRPPFFSQDPDKWKYCDWLRVTWRQNPDVCPPLLQIIRPLLPSIVLSGVLRLASDVLGLLAPLALAVVIDGQGASQVTENIWVLWITGKLWSLQTVIE